MIALFAIGAPLTVLIVFAMLIQALVPFVEAGAYSSLKSLLAKEHLSRGVIHLTVY
jgi:hypothetical protein